jgi:hypothetical protein
VAERTGAWGRVQESDGAPDLWAAREGASGVEWAVFCAVESSFPRAFQRYRMCRDRSPVAADPRVAVGPFGDESASWQRGDRISDGGGWGAGDS